MKTDISTAASRHAAKLGATMFDELIVDNFAGAGGASKGIEAAAGRCVDIAINHDQHSVKCHKINHPHTHHLCEDVFDVDPIAATAGRPVGLAWFSPDCKHFSRAKGGKPVQKKIRGLAWIVVKWAKLVRPRIIILENVREFQDWGPLTADNRPCPDRKGDTFRRWKAQLQHLGYIVDHRVLNAADFGAPTHRRRFFLVARCDGKPIEWPLPTHGPGRKPYRTAAECIDWTIPCPSIFLTKAESRVLRVVRPLAEKTMRRIAMGLKRYVIDNPKPFIVTCNHSGPDFRGQSVDEPFKTVTGSRDAHGLVMPFVAGVGGRAGQSPATGGDAPIGTITAKNDRAVVTPLIVRCAHGEESASGKRWGEGYLPLTAPLPTVTASKDFAVVAPILVDVQNAGWGNGHRDVGRPAHTITANPKGGGVAIAAAIATHYGQSIGAPVETPLATMTQCNHHSLVAASITEYHGEKANETRAKSLTETLPTADTSNRFGLVSAFLAKHYTGVVGHTPDRPLGTIAAIDHHSVEASAIIHLNHGGESSGKQCSGMDEPMRTITAGGLHAAEVRAFLTKYYGAGDGQRVDEPMHTVTTKDRLGVITVLGHQYQIVDIGLRMLRPLELLRAQFGKHAKGYILLGTQAQQVAGIGNSVPPDLAEAMVRVNFVEKCEVAP